MFDGKELGSNEGSTQGDPNAMIVYRIAPILFLKHLVTCYAESNPKIIAHGEY